MKQRSILTLICVMAVLLCNGQSFLSKYPELTKENLKEFFLDWKAYSDSVASMAVITDSLIDKIVSVEYASYLQPKFWKRVSRRYLVVPQYIEVERFNFDIDSGRNVELYVSCMTDQGVCHNVTPILPFRVLYLTSDIEATLSEFAGGLKRNNKIEKINKKHVKALGKYIPVDYGHWGGYWWFTSFPMITNIYYLNNLICVCRRTSWCTGDEILYKKENNQFVRLPEPQGGWIE